MGVTGLVCEASCRWEETFGPDGRSLLPKGPVLYFPILNVITVQFCHVCVYFFQNIPSYRMCYVNIIQLTMCNGIFLRLLKASYYLHP